jgi:hypothetical protein
VSYRVLVVSMWRSLPRFAIREILLGVHDVLLLSTFLTGMGMGAVCLGPLQLLFLDLYGPSNLAMGWGVALERSVAALPWRYGFGR